METPGTLNGYFDVVDDFFAKTFRSDCSLFLSIDTRQYSSVIENTPLVNLNDDRRRVADTLQQVEAVPEPTSDLLEPAKASYAENSASNFVAFSPRLALYRDGGGAFGRVKALCGFRVPHVCDGEQGIILNSDGVVAGTLKLKNLVDGLLVGGRVSVNMIAPASQDVTAVDVKYKSKEFYYNTRYQRNGLGSSNLQIDSGTTFFNILAGAGFERQRLSFLEQHENADQVDVIYAGVGFTGVDWSVAAKMARTTEAWNTVRVAMTQRLSPSTLIACAYHYELSEAQARVSLGFTQGFRLRLPALLQPSSSSSSSSSSLSTEEKAPEVGSKFLIACKAESDGVFAATLRGRFNNAILWGVVLQKNMLQESAKVRCGLVLSMERDQTTSE